MFFFKLCKNIDHYMGCQNAAIFSNFSYAIMFFTNSNKVKNGSSVSIKFKFK